MAQHLALKALLELNVLFSWSKIIWEILVSSYINYENIYKLLGNTYFPYNFWEMNSIVYLTSRHNS